MRRRLADEQGFSLVELLVVMVLMGIVGTVVSTSLVRGMKTSTEAQSRIQALSDLQRAAERVARELRVADPLCLPTPGMESGELGAVVYRDGDHFRHNFSVQVIDGEDVLVQEIERFLPDGTTTTANSQLITEFGNDELTPAPPLFQYINRSGSTAVPPGSAAQVVITLSDVVMGDEPITVQTTVEVRNTRYTGGSAISGGAVC